MTPVLQKLFAQCVPSAQTLPHEPQLLLSLVKSWQTLEPHGPDPGGHAHVLLMHTMPAVQTFPHEPQLPASLVVSVHCPLQTVPRHLHVPPSQTSFAGQTAPQAPQFAASCDTSMHAPPHSIWPGAQAHVPFAQIMVGGHTFPQVPQFWGWLLRFTHAPLQFVSFDRHALAQLPLEQTSSPQVFPHLPQLSWSVASTTQTPLQLTWPLGQSLPPCF